MAEKTPEPTKPIMDVAHPGKSSPHDNSKAVIITRRPMVADPMFIKDKPKADALGPLSAPILPSFGKTKTKTVQPTGEAAPEAEAKPEPQPEAKVEPEVEVKVTKPEQKTIDPPKPEAKPVEEPKAVAPEPTPAEETPTTDPDQKPATGTDEAKPTDKSKEQIDNQEEIKHDAEIEKLIVGKKYELPVNAVEKRRTKHFVALGVILSILLALAWVNIALDAGLIEIDGVKALTDFF